MDHVAALLGRALTRCLGKMDIPSYPNDIAIIGNCQDACMHLVTAESTTWRSRETLDREKLVNSQGDYQPTNMIDGEKRVGPQQMDLFSTGLMGGWMNWKEED